MKNSQTIVRSACRIHLATLLANASHLNPIERLWAVMNAHVARNQFYITQKQLADAILQFFRETISRKWRNFRIKITDNVRTIPYQSFRDWREQANVEGYYSDN